jgi:hypothetical protein
MLVLIIVIVIIWRRRRTRREAKPRRAIEQLNKGNGYHDVEPHVQVSLRPALSLHVANDRFQQIASVPVVDNQTRIVQIGESSEKTAVFWRDQIPASLSSVMDIHRRPAPTSPTTPTDRARRGSRASSIEMGPMHGEPVAEQRAPFGRMEPNTKHNASTTIADPALNVDHLLARAESIRSRSGRDGTRVTELQQRLAELGPIPEVLEALQELIRNSEVDVRDADSELPRYEEGRRTRLR